VGPLVDLMILPRDALDGGYRLHFNEDEPIYRDLAKRWGEGLVSAVGRRPRFFWQKQN
jgi:predicted proteasome-type protease